MAVSTGLKVAPVWLQVSAKSNAYEKPRIAGFFCLLLFFVSYYFLSPTIFCLLLIAAQFENWSTGEGGDSSDFGRVLVS